MVDLILKLVRKLWNTPALQGKKTYGGAAALFVLGIFLLYIGDIPHAVEVLSLALVAAGLRSAVESSR